MEKSAGQKDTQEIEKTVLSYMGKNGQIDNSENFGNEHNISKDDLEKVLKSLLVDEYLNLDVIERKIIELTDEGNSYA